MLTWIVRGLRTGVVTSPYPRRAELPPLRTVPKVDTAALTVDDCLALATVCPTRAMTCSPSPDGCAFILDYGACISCGLCAEALPGAVSMSSDYELAVRDSTDLRTTYELGRNGNGRRG